MTVVGPTPLHLAPVPVHVGLSRRPETNLTSYQRRLWASQRRAPDSPLQNMALVTHLGEFVGIFDADHHPMAGGT